MPNPTLRCCCVSHGCGEFKTADGQAGFLVDARTFRKHAKEDIKQGQIDAYAASTEAAARATAKHEAEVIDALGRLNIANSDASSFPGAVEPLTRLPHNNVERAKKMLRDADMVQDTLASLKRQISDIGVAPSIVDRSSIDRALGELNSIASSIALESTKLQTISFVKTPAVVAIHRQVYLCLQDVEADCRGAIETWRVVLEKLDEEHFAQGTPSYDTGKHHQPLFEGVKPLLQVVMLMVTVCHVILRLPRRGTFWLFTLTKYIIEFAVKKALNSDYLPDYFNNLVENFPRDIRAAGKPFTVDGKSEVYAVCPKCHAIYPPSYTKDIPIYREKCNAKKYGSRCKELLTRPKTVGKHKIYVPIKQYVVFDFKDWLAGLLSRSGYEKTMDKAWDKMEVTEDGLLTDIFHGSNIRNFKGPDNKTHFSQWGGSDAGHYLFSLSLDFFNPLRIMAAGKKISVGVITLACLNIPIEERYKPENMFSQVVPGPKEPPLDAINPYLEPIVDAFLELWTGVEFTLTCDWRKRLILCALIVVICDLPGGRKTGGFGAFAHELFCTRCLCRRSQHMYAHYDYQNWTLRTGETCREQAESFRDAPSKEEADKLFEETALRWSALLRLPYYNPSTFLVVDVMHNLFLGLIKEHFQNILGYNRKKPDEEVTVTGFLGKIKTGPENPMPITKRPLSSLRSFLNWLKKPLEFHDTEDPQFEEAVKKWADKTHLPSLIYIARGYNCFPTGSKLQKIDYARSILKWRVEQVEVTVTLTNGNVFTTEEMEALWSDLGNIVKPSWVTSVPTTLSSSGPKLKSDQWRMVGSLYLPVTLIRLWSEPDIGQERQDLLHLTMLLLSAIVIGSSRVTSKKHCDRYLQLMVEYRRELERLFPFYEPHPNHHMAMHIPDFLQMYGPAPGWWAFPFERVIGMLQRISTNHKPGEYEETIVRSWHRTSNFRGLFKKSTCPQAIRNCAQMFDTLVRPEARSTLTPDVLEQSETLDADDGEENLEDFVNGLSALVGNTAPLSTTLFSLFKEVQGDRLVPTEAHLRTHIRYQGLSYTTQHRHEGNSCVMFRDSATPYSIQVIVQFLDSNKNSLRGTWLVVRRHESANAVFDPYQRYPELGARLWGRDLASKLEAKPLSDVDTHFAKCEVPAWDTDKEVIVAVSLRRDM